MSYTCAYCGKEFGEVEARTKCELLCAERIKKEEEQKKKELAEFERKSFEKEIDQLEEAYISKIEAYMEKYRKLPPNFDFSYKFGVKSHGGNEDDFWAGLISDLLG